jgi:glutathione S-transferase
MDRKEGDDRVPVLYGFWLSPYMSLVAHMLKESGIDFRYERVSPFSGDNRADSHRARNAIGKIPTFEDANGQLVSESQAICRYLARTYPTARPFYPCDDPVLCAEVDTFNDFLTFSIGGPFFNWFVYGEYCPRAWRVKAEEECRIFSLWSRLAVRGDLGRLVNAARMTPFLLGPEPYLPDFHLFYTLEHGKTFAALFDEPAFDFMAGNDTLVRFYDAMLSRQPAREVLLEQAAELPMSKRELFEEMEGALGEMLQVVKPLLATWFGHEV